MPRDGGHFRVLTDNARRPFQSFEDFVRFREPYGLGMETEVVDAIFREPDGTKTLDALMAERHAAVAKARQDAKTINPNPGGSAQEQPGRGLAPAGAAAGAQDAAVQVPGSAQRFLATHVAVYNTSNVQRHLISCRTLRAFRAEAMAQWHAAAAA